MFGVPFPIGFDLYTIRLHCVDKDHVPYFQFSTTSFHPHKTPK